MKDMTTEQSLQQLFSRRAWHKNTGIGASTARTYRKRFRNNELELPTKIKILKASGYQLVKDMDWKMNPSVIRSDLMRKIFRNKAFWSYDTKRMDCLTDEILIEKVLLFLDIEDITSLFLLFERQDIRKVWLEKMVSQEPMYHVLNRLYAVLFFGIKNPDRYITRFLKKRQQSLYARINRSD
jgi:hypothetical protein